MSLERKNKKKVLVICPHPVGYAPGQRLKYEQYFDLFRNAGYDITVSPFMSEQFQKIVYKKGKFLQKIFWTMVGYARRIADLFRIRSFDIVYVFLWVGPFAPPILEWCTRKLAKKMIYDIDDLVFLTPPSSTNPLIHYLRSPKNHISLMRSADHVITCTPYLDAFVKKYNLNTTDISSTINTDLYKPKPNYCIKEKFTIGWSGSHSTSKYLHLLDDVFKKLSHTTPFKLLVMGDPHFSIEGVDVEAIAWREEYEVDTIRRFDIGVYPLPDEEWVLGKSGLKAIQYMAMGIPTLATAIGTNYRVIEDGVSGFLISKQEEWLDKIVELINDIDLRKRIGQEARKKVERSFSIKANESVYLKILANVSDK